MNLSASTLITTLKAIRKRPVEHSYKNWNKAWGRFRLVGYLVRERTEYLAYAGFGFPGAWHFEVKLQRTSSASLRDTASPWYGPVFIQTAGRIGGIHLAVLLGKKKKIVGTANFR